MAEVLASLKKIGGNGEQYTETSLWTNGSPSNDFNAQTITISDSISNYKYIAIDYCYNKSNTGVTSRVIYDVTDFKKAIKDGSTNHTISGLTIEGANNVNYARPVFYISDTSIAFGLSSTLNGSGAYAAGAIPLEILGINELAHGEGVLATPFQLELKSTIANGRSVIAFDKSTFPYTKFRVISKVNNLRYIGNGSWVTLAVGDIVDFSALPDTNLTIDVSGSTTSTASSIEFYN